MIYNILTNNRIVGWGAYGTRGEAPVGGLGGEAPRKKLRPTQKYFPRLGNNESILE